MNTATTQQARVMFDGIRAAQANPYRESQLGFHLWAKGWRPAGIQECPRCNIVTAVKINGNREAHCQHCKAVLAYLWEHDQYPESLLAYEIWRRIVLKQWGVDIARSETERSYFVAEELSEREEERLRQERVL